MGHPKAGCDITATSLISYDEIAAAHIKSKTDKLKLNDESTFCFKNVKGIIWSFKKVRGTVVHYCMFTTVKFASGEITNKHMCTHQGTIICKQLNLSKY